MFHHEKKMKINEDFSNLPAFVRFFIAIKIKF